MIGTGSVCNMRAVCLLCLGPEYRLYLSLTESISHLTPVTEGRFSASFSENEMDESEMKLHNAVSLFPSQTHDQEQIKLVGDIFYTCNAHHWNEETWQPLDSPSTATQARAQFDPIYKMFGHSCCFTLQLHPLVQFRQLCPHHSSFRSVTAASVLR